MRVTSTTVTLISPPHILTHTHTYTLTHTHTHTHRLVSARHVSKNEEYEKLVTERAKSNFKDAKIGVRTGKEMFQEQDRKMKENSGSGTSDTAATATHSSSHDDSVHLPQVTPEIVSEFGTVEPNEKGSQTDFSVPPPPEPVPGPSQSPHTLVPSGDGTQRDSSPEPVPKPGTKAFSKGRRKLIVYDDIVFLYGHHTFSWA